VQARAGAYIPEKVLVTDLAWALPIGRQTSGTLPRPLWRPAEDTAGQNWSFGQYARPQLAPAPPSCLIQYRRVVTWPLACRTVRPLMQVAAPSCRASVRRSRGHSAKS
jgi:hypothetical protein